MALFNISLLLFLSHLYDSISFDGFTLSLVKIEICREGSHCRMHVNKTM